MAAIMNTTAIAPPRVTGGGARQARDHARDPEDHHGRDHRQDGQHQIDDEHPNLVHAETHVAEAFLFRPQHRSHGRSVDHRAEYDGQRQNPGHARIGRHQRLQLIHGGVGRALQIGRRRHEGHERPSDKGEADGRENDIGQGPDQDGHGRSARKPEPFKCTFAG
ncbi:hypothetical protein [Brevundimonas abyssalis]|uniref:hypothetical protein n=1 Tax=Brevundimonas abyssalis TaxID=1125965 RepID=UPI0011D22AF2|nr:hypothetical protein [Brevundimonas abyssalis]